MNELIQQGAITELSGSQNAQYILNDKSTFALTEFKVLRSQTKNFIKCAKVTYNGKIKLLYFTASFKSFRNMLSSLDEDAFLTVIANVLNAIIEIKNNGFLSCTNLDLSFDKIFVDQSTFEIKFIYLPVNNPNTDTASFENELRSEFIKLISTIPAFSSEKMKRVSGYLSNGSMSLNQLYGSVCSEIKGRSSASSGTRKNTGSDKGSAGGAQKPLRFVSVNSPAKINFNITTPEFVIGKNPSQVNGVITFNNAISRVHCRITYQNNMYSITDLGSANGTFINGSRIVAHRPYQIKNGDMIRLANSDFRIQL